MALTPSLNQIALEALESETCVCGSRKKRKWAFCYKCYELLPIALKAALARTIRQGFAEAYDEAKDWLRIETKRIPRDHKPRLFNEPEAG